MPKIYKARSYYAAETSLEKSTHLRENLRRWNERNPEKRRWWMWRANNRRKEAVMNVLTNGKQTCRWCGQGDLDVLTVDHIANDGRQHRQTFNDFYAWLIRNDYPPGFQVLCANCNLKKEIKRKRQVAEQYQSAKTFQSHTE